MKERKKLLVICPYPEKVAPSQRLKYEQYFDYFRQNGYDLTISSFMTVSMWKIVYKKGNVFLKVFWTIFGYFKRVYDLFRLPFYDGIYISLWVTPFGPPIFEFFFCLFNKKIIYDIDDMIFLGHSSVANKFIGSLKGKYKMIYLMKKAKHVITCTPHLDQFVRNFNLNTTDISSTINTESYIPVNSYKNDRRLVLGWSGSHSTSKYMHLLENVLKQLKKRYDFEILVIGDPNFSITGLTCRAISWEEKTEISNLQQIDIGLYPLPLDDDWVLGKSGLKALQYMALGIPTIATGVGANFRVIEDGVSGYLVKTESDWIEKLSGLIENPELRRKIGIEGRKRVEEFYSINANKNTYLDIINKVSENN